MKTIITQFGQEENNYKLIEEKEAMYQLEALKRAKYYMKLTDDI
nr:hypothetical protein [Clostridium botulinum]